jgi:hypothetical protein
MSVKTFLLHVCASSLALAQTQLQVDTLRTQLQSIQNKAAASLQIVESPSRPLNWKELVDADAAGVQLLAGQTRTTLSQVTTRSTSVSSGTNLQAALDLAQPGDTLVLEAGVEYKGNFILPKKVGTGVITITSSRMSELPAAGQRVTPADSAAMPRIVSANASAALATAPGAHHYRVVGVEFTTPAGVYNGGIVQLGSGNDTTDAALPYEIELDRVYVHGDTTVGSKRGVAFNGKALTVRNSWISDIKSKTQDAQAICGWNGPGPFVIVNNRLEATGENIMFGGAEPYLVGVTPSDITISGNHITKPLSWRGIWPVKNLLELKTGRRVLISGNILENNWTSAQVGYAILVKPGTENVKTAAITTDVTITNNIVRHSTGGINILGRNSTGGFVSNVSVRNNLFDDLGANWGTPPSLFSIIAGGDGIVIENNTAIATTLNTALTFDSTYAANNFVMRSNIVARGNYGVKGSGTAEGTATLTKYTPASIFTNNVIYGPGFNSAIYPSMNYFAAAVADIGFEDLAAGNVTLRAGSLYKGKGANGRDPGVDYAAVTAATQTVINGR